MNDKVKAFAEFERDRQLFRRTYLGVPYWQSVRLFFTRELLKIKQSPRIYNFSSILLDMLKVGKNLIADIIKYKLLSECDILYFDGCSYRVIDGKVIDSYFDYFHFEAEYKIQRCFYIYSRQKRASREGIGTTMPRLLECLLNLCLKMKLNIFRDKQEEKFIKQLAAELEKNFHMGFTSAELIQMIRKSVVIHKVYNKYYERLILNCKPRAIFVVCYYNAYLYPLYSAAGKYQIPVIEVQHGSIANHDAYWYEDISADGKEMPTHIFTYGSFWSRDIKLPENMKAVPVGNPFLEERKARYKSCLQDEKMIVIYSSSPAEKEMEQLAIDIWNCFRNKGYRIFFKVHPMEYDIWRQRYTHLQNYPQIQVVTQDMDLYELLSRARHHITYASTVLYEAAVFHTNRYIYDLGVFEENMQPLIELNLAYKFKTIEELERLFRMSMDTVFEHTSEIWMKGAENNGRVRLREIMNEWSCSNEGQFV